MSVNEDYRQLEIAKEVEQSTRSLAHSTMTVPKPSESYELLGEMHAITEHLAQVARQLVLWHESVADGVEYDGEDERSDGGNAAGDAATKLKKSASLLDAATVELMGAHSANGIIRWKH